MRQAYKSLSLTLGISAIGMFQTIAQNDHPNIVFMLTDDLGWNDLRPVPWLFQSKKSRIFREDH
jgi:hypothetical protein